MKLDRKQTSPIADDLGEEFEKPLQLKNINRVYAFTWLTQHIDLGVDDVALSYKYDTGSRVILIAMATGLPLRCHIVG